MPSCLESRNRPGYWMYNHGHGTIGGLAGVVNPIHLNMDALDLETTLNEQLHNFDVLVSGGVRYGRAAFGPVGGTETYFEGYGPTIGVEATRDVGSRGFHVVGKMRGSILFGEIHDAANNMGAVSGGAGLAQPVADDELAIVLAAQLGSGYTRETSLGEVSAKLVWETQAWMNDTFADEFVGIGSNLGFGGPTISFELRR